MFIILSTKLENFKKWKRNNNRWIFSKTERALVLPPDFQKLPRPNEIKQENKNEKKKKILKIF